MNERIMAYKPTILLIEKDESLRSLIHHFLNDDMRIVGYDSIVYGFEYLKKEKLPNVIVLGGTEPPENQLEFLAYLVDCQFFGHLPILALATHAMKAPLVNIYQGINQVENVIEKPIDMELFKTHIWKKLNITHVK